MLKVNSDKYHTVVNLWCTLYHRYTDNGQHDKASTVYKFVGQLPKPMGGRKRAR